MAANDDNKKLLQELDVLSHTLYQAHSARRTASLSLPRASGVVPSASSGQSVPSDAPTTESRSRPRRLSMSPFRSRPSDIVASGPPAAVLHAPHIFVQATAEVEKKGIWGWKPLRALSHIGMHRLAVLVSVEVVAIQSLPASMNGLRFSVIVRKKETKDGAVQTVPARVVQGAADFEETLFIRSHVFYSGGGSTGKPLRFEPRPFLIFPIAVDAPELDFGRSSVDLSALVKESMERSLEGSRVRQWESALKLSGKAKGGALLIKLGFQIMEDGGAGVYRQSPDIAAVSLAKGIDDSSSSLARRQSKSSFSISSPKGARSAPSGTPSKDGNSALKVKGIEDFNLDGDPAPPLPPHLPKPQTEIESKADDLDLPDFDVVDKGIEASLGEEKGVDVVSDHVTDDASVSTSTSISAAVSASGSNEVVKEEVQDSAQSARLTELESIAKQIKALELLMTNDDGEDEAKLDLGMSPPEETIQQLNPEEETTTREFLQLLELDDDNEAARYKLQQLSSALKPESKQGAEGEAMGYLPDLGKGLGPIVHTKDGGYLASMNPFDAEAPTGESPKLAMQISRPIIINDGYTKSSGGGGGSFELFQELAGKGLGELESKLLSLTAMDELVGKTAEQIAFEGIASAIVSGRNKELARSAAAKSVAALKSIASEMNEGRKERILTGIWNVKEEPLASAEEVLSSSLQKMEAMAVNALKLQADVAEEEAPFIVSPLVGRGETWLLDHATPLEDWLKKGVSETEAVILMVLIQLRDPLRRYEAVGAPMMAVVQAVRVGSGGGEEEEGHYKVCSLNIGGVKLSSGRKTRSVWDGERQRLTAMQWLVCYGMAKAGRRSKAGGGGKGSKDVLWSLSSRIMAEMWLKPIRNPDVKLLHP